MKVTQGRMPVKSFVMAAALITCASPAIAGSRVTNSSCMYSHYYGYSNCTIISTYIPDPVYDPENERREAAERLKEDAKWESFCQPKFRTDEYGVRRASYAKSGCEFGRSE